MKNHESEEHSGKKGAEDDMPDEIDLAVIHASDNTYPGGDIEKG